MVKAPPVSTTTSPVTVTAEVAVNSASDQLMGILWAMGSLSSAAPARARIP